MPVDSSRACGNSKKWLVVVPVVDVVIDLAPQQCQAHYAGAIERLYVFSTDGRRVLLPAAALRRVVVADGVHGVFRLSYDAQGRFQALQPLRRWPRP